MIFFLIKLSIFMPFMILSINIYDTVFRMSWSYKYRLYVRKVPNRRVIKTRRAE